MKDVWCLSGSISAPPDSRGLPSSRECVALLSVVESDKTEMSHSVRTYQVERDHDSWCLALENV
jgi:hypothetical protein